MLQRFISKKNEKGVKVTEKAIFIATKLDFSRKSLNNWLAKNEYEYKNRVHILLLTPSHKKIRVIMIPSYIHTNISC